MSVPDLIGRISDADSFVAFYPGVPATPRDDIQDALLYAHLFASHQYDVRQQWHNWMQSYRNRLEACGFVLQSLVLKDAVLLSHVEDFETASFRIDGTVASDRVSEMVRGAIKVLGIKDMVTRYLSNDGVDAHLESFQVVPCELTDAGDVGLVLCGLHISNDKGASSGTPRMILHFKGGSYRFDPQRYADRQQVVRTYLKGKAHAAIKWLEPRDFDLR